MAGQVYQVDYGQAFGLASLIQGKATQILQLIDELQDSRNFDWDGARGSELKQILTEYGGAHSDVRRTLTEVSQIVQSWTAYLQGLTGS